MPRIVVALFLLLVSACRRTEQSAVAPGSDAAKGLENGMYLVTDIFDKMPASDSAGHGRRIVAYRQVYDPPEERGAPRYVVIDVTQYVPFLFESAPTVTNDVTGRAILGIALDANYTERLKQFTTEHLGKSAAMIVGGDLVSVHKIRTVIAEGKLQITSCGADVCKVLHSKLVGAN